MEHVAVGPVIDAIVKHANHLLYGNIVGYAGGSIDYIECGKGVKIVGLQSWPQVSALMDLERNLSVVHNLIPTIKSRKRQTYNPKTCTVYYFTFDVDVQDTVHCVIHDCATGRVDILLLGEGPSFGILHSFVLA